MLIQALFPFFVAFVLGYVTAMPLGPINLTIIARTLQQGSAAAGGRVGAGACLTDTGYCAVAIFGIAAISGQSSLEYWLKVSGCVFIALFGVLFALRSGATQEARPQGLARQSGDFVTGVVVYLGNPFFVVFWAAVAEMSYSLGLPKTPLSQWSFVAGNLVGTYLWFLTIANLTHKKGRSLPPIWFLRVSRLLGAALVGIGLFGLVRTVRA